MTKNEIKTAIETAKVDKNKSTELLTFFDDTHAYCIHGIERNGEMTIVSTKLYPGKVTALDELPDDIENMEVMWFQELMKKYGNIYNAMDSLKK